MGVLIFGDGYFTFDCNLVTAKRLARMEVW